MSIDHACGQCLEDDLDGVVCDGGVMSGPRFDRAAWHTALKLIPPLG